MRDSPQDLYLDLIKKALAFLLWPEPPVPFEAFNYAGSPYARSALKRFLLWSISQTLRSRGLELVQQRDVSTAQREEGLILPSYAHTMIGLRRLDNIQFCIETAIREGIEGDLIETGVWRGGACILMRAVLAAHDILDRKVYVADSFRGLPKPALDRYPADEGDRHHEQRFLAVPRIEVESNFARYGLLDDKVIFIEGWFEDTLPNAPISRLAVLRLDGDMYGSTIVALTNLYPKLSRGGFCIIDDYSLKRCKQAVVDFRAENGINDELIPVDPYCVYWRKSETSTP